MIELETKIAYLEKTVDELNLSLYEQQKRMDSLERLLKKLWQHIEEGGESEDLPHVKPPHY